MQNRCPACGHPFGVCPGHGRNADPVAWGIVSAHHIGAHTRCHPDGCETAAFYQRSNHE